MRTRNATRFRVFVSKLMELALLPKLQLGHALADEAPASRWRVDHLPPDEAELRRQLRAQAGAWVRGQNEHEFKIESSSQMIRVHWRPFAVSRKRCRVVRDSLRSLAAMKLCALGLLLLLTMPVRMGGQEPFSNTHKPVLHAR